VFFDPEYTPFLNFSRISSKTQIKIETASFLWPKNRHGAHEGREEEEQEEGEEEAG